MSLPKIFFAVSVGLFSVIGALAILKKPTVKEIMSPAKQLIVTQEVNIDLLSSPASNKPQLQSKTTELLESELSLKTETVPEDNEVVIEHEQDQDGLLALFTKNSTCPIVETVAYKSHVSWKARRSAWLIDYANYFKTPLEFIYRSINGGNSASPVSISEGMQFNVYKRDVDFRFHIVVSMASCRMRLYYVIPQERRIVFLRSYNVCLGKKDSARVSGYCTPLGVFQLGNRVAVFRPRMMGTHKGKQVELIQVFGTRWLPFEKEINGCSEPAKGFGVHGTPMTRNSSGQLEEDNSSIGHYESEGCIRLSGKDLEEVFSVVSSRKTWVEVVPSFQQSQLFRGEV
jgi:hypothetical protein